MMKKFAINISKFFFIILLLTLVFFVNGLSSTKIFAAVEISTLEGLDAVRLDLAGDYVLMNDLDFDGSAWATGEGWNPIGVYPDYFTGTFDGQGHIISNLYINVPTWDEVGGVGLFGDIGHPIPATISNLGLVDVDITGTDFLGGLAGHNFKGKVTDCYVTGSVSGENSVGGLTGFSEQGETINSYFSGSVNGEYWVGGLIGYAYPYISPSIMTNSYSTGTVTAEYTIGGLIGKSEGSVITECYSTSTVTGIGMDTYYAGGLAGYSDLTITDSYATGNVIGFGEAEGIGGLVGYNYGDITNSFATGDISGFNYVGGLVGDHSSSLISNSYATGSVIGDDMVGGLAGYSGDGIDSSYSTGLITGNTYPGGLVGYNSDIVTNSFWDTQTSGMATSDGGTGKTTSEMKTLSTFSSVAWDILSIGNFDPLGSTVWFIDEATDSPRLFMEYEEPEEEPEEPEEPEEDPEIVTQTPTTITSNSVRLRGNLTSLGSFSTVQVYFQYKLVGGIWIDTPQSIKTSIGEYTYDLTGLNPNSDYEYRSVEEFGDSETLDYGAIQSFSTLPVVIPKVRITDMGLITNVVDKDDIFYYFTSTIVRIKGITYPNTTVKFETEGEDFTTLADSNGAFNITLTLPEGRSDIEYYAYDGYEDISPTRTLTLVIGTDYFPEWLLINLGLLTPPEEEEEENELTEETLPVDEDPQEEDESDEGEIPEDKIQRLQFLDNRGSSMIGALVEINGQEYYTDSNGEITMEELSSGVKYKVKIEYDGIRYEVDVLGPDDREGNIVINVSDGDIREGLNWKKILIYGGIGLFTLLFFIIIFKKEKEEYSKIQDN